MYRALIFIFGAVIGSFLNVCIYRLPLGKSLAFPRSFCPFCVHTIKWFDNIPLISFLILKGRCRYCKKNISIRYFIVELITALGGIWLFAHFSLSGRFFVYWFFISMLIVAAFIDMERQEIPDVISIPGMFIGMILVSVFNLDDAGSYKISFFNSGLSAVIGAGSMFLLGAIGELVFRREALGGGDVKLMGMIGAFLGWKLALLTFFLSPILGLGAGLIIKFRFKRDIMPYGPYLALGSVIALLYGERILDYLFYAGF